MDISLMELDPESCRNKDFVFILAIGRSGSTLLQGILNVFPRCLIRGENGGLMLNLFRAYRSLVESKIHATTETTPEHPWFGAEEINIDNFLLDVLLIITRQILGRRNFSDYDTLGFKEIRWPDPNSLWSFFDFMRLIFPRCKFILLTRDVDDILDSAWWPTRDRSSSANEIRAFYLMVRSAGLKNLFEVDYNDLRADSSNLRRLVEFLGKRYVPEINEVLNRPHSYNTSESNLREREIRSLRKVIEKLSGD